MHEKKTALISDQENEMQLVFYFFVYLVLESNLIYLWGIGRSLGTSLALPDLVRLKWERKNFPKT